MSEYHIPVMLEESVSALISTPDGIYADATFGGGGHTAEILSRLHSSGRLIAFDRDSDALANAPEDSRLTLIHNNFRFIENFAAQLGVRFDGILADLGVSSHQFDTAGRGFSFRFEDAPLDMRMNTSATRTAAEVVNEASEEELCRILRDYGEVDGASRAARLIVKARGQKALKTCGDLDSALSPILPHGAEHKVLSKVYQALRIEVNQEMHSLEKFLEGSVLALKEGGRMVIITYHSLEDRMVKNFFRTAPMEPVTRKPILPREEEIAANTRARSAKLRVAVKSGRNGE